MNIKILLHIMTTKQCNYKNKNGYPTQEKQSTDMNDDAVQLQKRNMDNVKWT